MPTTFWGLFLFSTALSLSATFVVVGASGAGAPVRGGADEITHRLR